MKFWWSRVNISNEGLAKELETTSITNLCTSWVLKCGNGSRGWLGPNQTKKFFSNRVVFCFPTHLVSYILPLDLISFQVPDLRVEKTLLVLKTWIVSVKLQSLSSDIQLGLQQGFLFSEVDSFSAVIHFVIFDGNTDFRDEGSSPRLSLPNLAEFHLRFFKPCNIHLPSGFLNQVILNLD